MHDAVCDRLLGRISATFLVDIAADLCQRHPHKGTHEDHAALKRRKACEPRGWALHHRTVESHAGQNEQVLTRN